jgi:hypothetical protein
MVEGLARLRPATIGVHAAKLEKLTALVPADVKRVIVPFGKSSPK